MFKTTEAKVQSLVMYDIKINCTLQLPTTQKKKKKSHVFKDSILIPENT